MSNNSELKGDITKTLGGHLRAGLEEMKKVFGRHKRSKKTKANQLNTDHEKRENHIIKKKKEQMNNRDEE